MIKKKKAENPRIRELQDKIRDESYIQDAIQRIALVMSNRLVDSKGSANE
ncbi:MAG TPA: hypothetical protein GXZ47_09850 [Treponema sp.]|nr:hypothetical protein [Treponema sp.]